MTMKEDLSLPSRSDIEIRFKQIKSFPYTGHGSHEENHCYGPWEEKAFCTSCYHLVDISHGVCVRCGHDEYFKIVIRCEKNLVKDGIMDLLLACGKSEIRWHLRRFDQPSPWKPAQRYSGL